MDDEGRRKLAQAAWDTYHNDGIVKIEDLYCLTLRSYQSAVKAENAKDITRYGYTLALLSLMSSRDIDWIDLEPK